MHDPESGENTSLIIRPIKKNLIQIIHQIMVLYQFTFPEFDNIHGYVGFPGGQTVKNMPAMQDTQGQSLGCEDPLEKGMATQSSILAWRISWPE